MNNYFQENEYLHNYTTKESEENMKDNNFPVNYFKVDYNNYTNRKSTRKKVGYVEKQNT